MGWLPIVPKYPATPHCLPDFKLPAFYMEDHSRLGLRVDAFSEVVALLRSLGTPTGNRDGCLQLQVASPAQLQALLKVLDRHGLAYELTDLMEQVYQG